MRIGDHPAVVENLIKQGQRIESTDSHGWTPLDWAVLEGRKTAIEVLLSRPSTIIDRISLSSEPILHLACKGGASVDIIERLMSDPRIDINAKNPEGWTVLHWCLSREKFHHLAYILLSRKDLDINIPDSKGTTYIDQVFHEGLFESLALKIAHDGRTALHVAAEHRNLEACKSLLKSGASYLVKDNSHRLPIHIAAEQGHRSIVLVL
ncbi:ankyrin, partial [Lindgomyces ingoldianus]